jgi:ribonuclease-3
MGADLKELQKKIGYHFKDEHWLERAMTHSSTNDNYNYQRLEFLGDRVLGLVIAHQLFENFKNEREGGLAKRHTALIQGETCTIIGRNNNLSDYIIMSESEEISGGRINENILADIVESLLGAIYIDGGYDAAQKVILNLWGDMIYTHQDAPQDPKTELQEWLQARSLGLPVYQIINRSGPDHAPIFTVEITIQTKKGHQSAQADGSSRRQTEKTVAEKMLNQLKNDNK